MTCENCNAIPQIYNGYGLLTKLAIMYLVACLRVFEVASSDLLILSLISNGASSSSTYSGLDIKSISHLEFGSPSTILVWGRYFNRPPIAKEARLMMSRQNCNIKFFQ